MKGFISQVQIISAQHVLVSIVTGQRYPTLPSESVKQYARPVAAYRVYLMDLEQVKVLSQTPEFASGGSFAYYNQQLLIPLNQSVELDPYALFSVKALQITFVLRGKSLLKLEAPESCCVFDQEIIVSGLHHSAVFRPENHEIVNFRFAQAQDKKVRIEKSGIDYAGQYLDLGAAIDVISAAEGGVVAAGEADGHWGAVYVVF